MQPADPPLTNTDLHGLLDDNTIVTVLTPYVRAVAVTYLPSVGHYGGNNR